MTMLKESFNYEDDRRLIEEVLERFQEGYTKRDIEVVDEYMEELFQQSDDLVIMGTSDGEWCLGFEAAKKLVVGDWKYWGDVKIDVKGSKINILDNKAWIATTGTIRYEFEDTDDRYNRYLDSVKDYLKEEGEFAKLTPKEKITEIKFLLSHFIRQRKGGKRVYYWPLRLTGLLIKDNNQWKFRYMQFSLPIERNPEFSTRHIKRQEDYYNKANEKVSQYIQRRVHSDNSDIQDFMNNFQNDYLNIKEKSEQDVVQIYFTQEDSKYMIDGDFSWHNGYDEIVKAINIHREQWDNVSINKDLTIINKDDNVAWVVSEGIINKKMTEEEAILKEIQNIKALCEGNESSENKLFHINKNISILMMEICDGEDYIWPFRFEGILIKENEKWKIHAMQVSFNFYWILEDKYNLPVHRE